LNDPRELETFLDGVLTSQLKENHIPGATISVVKDGKLFLAKGYGNADIEQNKPVVADTTLFRIGSISKMFTWTAILQLAEEGKVNLHTDINTYLKTFKIPATYPQPITLENLLTHTAGFEDSGKGIFVAKASDLQPLGTWLPNHIPARVRPPGVFTSYSNIAALRRLTATQEQSHAVFLRHGSRKGTSRRLKTLRVGETDQLPLGFSFEDEGAEEEEAK